MSQSGPGSPQAAAEWAREGETCLEQKRWRDAAQAFGRAATLCPDSVEYWNNLGGAQEELGDFAAAKASFLRAVALDPVSPLPHFNLGCLQFRLLDPDAAIEQFRIAVTLDPDFVEGWHELGRALRAADHAPHAIAALTRAAALAPNSAPIHLLLGHTLYECGKSADAIRPMARATELDRDNPVGWLALGHTLLETGAAGAALLSLRRSLELQPDSPTAHYDTGKALAELGEIVPAIEHLRRAAALGDTAVSREAEQTIAVLIPGSPAESDATVLAARRHWVDAHLETSGSARPTARLDPAKIRVGYISSFFQHANWMKPVWGLINEHDRSRFEIHLFSDAPRGAIGADYRPAATDSHHDITGLDNERAAARVRAAELDILVDLNGYSRPDRLSVLTHEPAPVLAAWFNMYATTGLPCVDYLISDAASLREDEESHYSERILRVPGSYLTFRVTHPVPEVSEPPMLRAKVVTFGCLASLYKLDDGVLDRWAEILCAVVDSRLLIRNRGLDHESNRAHLLARLERRGVTAERVALLGGADHFEFLRSYADIDIALDPFPYNGGTTTTEALWQGVPVLTFRGDRWASRTSTSLLRAANLEEFVATDAADYVHRAVGLARDPGTPARLDALRRGMRAALLASPVCDTVRFARDMEALYREVCSKGIAARG